MGTAFGVDFNPQADRLRIVSDAGINYNVNVSDGAVTAQTPLNPGNPDVRAVAYQNNQPTGTPTVLLGVDIEGPDRLVQQVPATGALTARGFTGTDLDAADTPSVGLDVEAVTNATYAVLEPTDGADGFYRVDTTTGAATLVGAFTSTNEANDVEDIAIASARFIVGNTTASEGTDAVVTVTRTGDSLSTASLVLTPGPGSASTDDFDPATRTVTFAAGQPTATATVTIRTDTVVEPSETFTVSVSSITGSGGNESAGAPGIVTIVDASGGGGGGGGGGVTPTPTTSPTPTPTGSPTATPAQCAVPARVLLERDTIIATGSAGVSVTAAASSTVELFAYTRPSTTYRVVRTGTTDAAGRVTFPALRPPANTRLYAQVRGCTTNPVGGSVVLNVRTALSLFATRSGPRTYVFSGDSLPARRGGLIVSLYRVTASGQQVLTAQTRASATTGEWRINRRFLGTGRFGFVVRTGQDLQNAPGSSNVRPTIIF